MVSREPRQIIGHAVSRDKTSQTIQCMVDTAPDAERYCTDGYSGYLDIVYPGKHIFNIHNKKDTFTVEGVNADLRHYIPTLARRSRCFPRKLENLQAVVAVFVRAIIVLALRNQDIEHFIQGRIYTSLFLIFFNCSIGHSFFYAGTCILRPGVVK